LVSQLGFDAPPEAQFEQNTQRVNNLRQEILDLFARMRKLKKTIDEKAGK
jgi:hypothetical protein